MIATVPRDWAAYHCHYWASCHIKEAYISSNWRYCRGEGSPLPIRRGRPTTILKSSCSIGKQNLQPYFSAVKHLYVYVSRFNDLTIYFLLYLLTYFFDMCQNTSKQNTVTWSSMELKNSAMISWAPYVVGLYRALFRCSKRHVQTCSKFATIRRSTLCQATYRHPCTRPWCP